MGVNPCYKTKSVAACAVVDSTRVTEGNLHLRHTLVPMGKIQCLRDLGKNENYE